jgi:hypothetical protein
MFQKTYSIDIKKFDSKLNTPFNNKAIFFFTNRNDLKGVFPSFLIIDQNQTLIITSFLSLNFISPFLKKIQEIEALGFVQPHSSIMINETRFLIFTYSSERNNFFYYLNLDEKYISLIDGNEFENIVGSFRRIVSFGTTFFKDPSDEFFFIINCKSISKGSAQKSFIDYYKVSLDFTRSLLLYSREIKDNQNVPPHSTRKVNGTLLSSEFNETKLLYRNFEFYALSDLKEKILRDFILENQEVKEISQSKNTLQTFLEVNGESSFILSAKYSAKYSFTLSKGYIRYFNTKKELKFELPYSKPAHFELGINNFIYLSCHNFFIDENGDNHYDSPAIILKISLSKQKPEIIKEFRDESGYRFTSHQVLNSEEGEFIYTIGHPNRLFIIDSKRMTLVKFIDIEDKILTSSEDIFRLVSTERFDKKSITSFCISNNGEYIVFLRNDEIIKYNIRLQCIVYKANISKLFHENTNIFDIDFNYPSFHAQVAK